MCLQHNVSLFCVCIIHRYHLQELIVMHHSECHHATMVILDTDIAYDAVLFFLPQVLFQVQVLLRSTMLPKFNLTGVQTLDFHIMNSTCHAPETSSSFNHSAITDHSVVPTVSCVWKVPMLSPTHWIYITPRT